MRTAQIVMLVVMFVVVSMMAGCEACEEEGAPDAAVGVPTEPDIGTADPVGVVDAGNMAWPSK